MTVLAHEELRRARRALTAAEALVAIDADSATSRAFYGAFHALTALFALREQRFSRHTAVRAALHRDLIQPGLLPQECGRLYDHLLDLRDTADYGGPARLTEDDAKRAVESAREILDAVVQACPELDDG